MAKTRRTPVKSTDRQEEDQESCVGTNACRPAQELGCGIFPTPQHGQVVIELVTKVDGETEVRNGERERERDWNEISLCNSMMIIKRHHNMLSCHELICLSDFSVMFFVLLQFMGSLEIKCCSCKAS